MKRGLLIVIAILVTLSLVAIGCAAPTVTPTTTATTSAAPTAAPIKVTFTSAYAPPPDLSGTAMKWFMDEMTERSGGSITFEVYWGGALGKAMEHLDMIGTGVADMGCCPLGGWASRAPCYDFEYAFPFGPTDPEIVTETWITVHNEFPCFQEQLIDDNVRCNHANCWDTYDLMSTEPMTELSDFEGKIVGLWGKWYPKQVEVVGGSGVPAPFPERYMQLKLGVFDATLVPIDCMITGKFYEVCKYLTIVGTGAYMPHTIVMNLDFWNSLTPERQKLFDETGKDAMRWHAAHVKEVRSQNMELLMQQGVTFYKLTQEQKVEWMNLCPDQPAQWAEEVEALGYPGWEIASRYQEVSAGLGYEWPRQWAIK